MAKSRTLTETEKATLIHQLESAEPVDVSTLDVPKHIASVIAELDELKHGLYLDLVHAKRVQLVFEDSQPKATRAQPVDE